MRKSLAVVSGLLLVLGIVGALVRVRALEAVEVDYVSPFTTVEELAHVEPRHAVGRMELHEGQAVIFEVCGREGFAPEAWTGRAAFEVWSVDGPHLLRRTEVDAAQIARVHPVGAVACMEIARAERLPTDGAHEVAVTWGEGAPPAELARVAVAARVHAIGWPARLDGLVHGATFAGALLLVIALLLPRRAAAPPASLEGSSPSARSARSDASAPSTGLRVAAALAALLGTELLLAHLPFVGRTYAFVRGLVLATVQLVAALALVRPPHDARVAEALALVRPARLRLWLPLAIVTGLLLPRIAVVLQALVPATAESHVASLVLFPSGVLAVRVVGAFAPVVEEVFFRGFVYGEVERRVGSVAAFVTTVLAFALVHLPQVWGDLGSLLAIFTTGLLLTALRCASGSAAVPALAHLVYNALL